MSQDAALPRRSSLRPRLSVLSDRFARFRSGSRDHGETASPSTPPSASTASSTLVDDTPTTERAARKATDNAFERPSDDDIRRLAALSEDYKANLTIMNVLDMRFNDRDQNWRRVYKGLIVLRELLLRGSNFAVESARERESVVEGLSSFPVAMERGVDRRELVCATAQSILDVLRDENRLRRIRQRVQEDHEPGGHVSAEQLLASDLLLASDVLLASDPSVAGERSEPDVLDISATAIARAEAREQRSSLAALDISPYISSVAARPHGFGGLSDIYQGVFQTENRSTKIAIKVVRANAAAINETILRRHRQEVAVWREIDHVNILPMLGLYSGIGVLPAMVSPWCDNGDINTYLKSRESSSTFKAVRLLLLVHILQGLHYLHGYCPVIVHGDLKGANILVSDDCIARLCDFGFAKVQTELSASLTSQSTLKGTLRWMAPELFDEDDAQHTVWSDVWAFGCVLYEIFSGTVPYHRLRSDQAVIIALAKRQMPDIPGNVPESVQAILTCCWAVKPSSRIDVQRLLGVIHELAISAVSAVLLWPGKSNDSLGEEHIHLLQTWNRSTSEPYRIGDSPSASDCVCNALAKCIKNSAWPPLDRVVAIARTLLDTINPTYDAKLGRSARPKELRHFASLLGQADASLAAEFLRRFTTPMIARLQCHNNAVSSVTWTPCGSRFLASSYDGTVSMWDPHQRVEVFSRKQARAILVDSVAISSDSRFIAAASADYGLQVWDSGTGTSYQRELHGDKILWLSFSRQDRRVIAATGSAVFSWAWKAHSTFRDMNPMFSPTGENGDLLVDPEFVALAFSEDEACVAYSLKSAVGLWVHCFDEAITWRLSDAYTPTHIAWSPDRQLLACFSASTGALYVSETYNQDVGPRLFNEQPPDVTSLVFSRDNRYVAGGSGNSLWIWDVMSGGCTRVLEHPSLHKGVSSISYSPDGSYIATGSYDGTVRVWVVEDHVWAHYDGDESRSPYPPCSAETARWDDYE